MSAHDPSDIEIDIVLAQKELAKLAKEQMLVQDKIRVELRTRNLIAYFDALKQPAGPGADHKELEALGLEIRSRLKS
ncbi:hypothetical protein F1D05_09955 [Kribbella qitaiheensis]|uniref:Uncharacterized protein n=1 Tax=Kribbella qitaiheensis TaxID=1544730 RepID=A0A7G6WVZ1_9ACTN|nr:hypothetical protein [Kribbella qitaiheensis]QNE18156.1 hypothetical protein F1D05_09955 [Kribbella qitaiheensis]